MTNFLDFLNTTDRATLTKIPGITTTIAANIIKARPFDFVEDCAKVQGVGKKLLGRMQSFFETELNDSPNRALIPVEEDATPAVIEKSQPAQEPVEEQPTFLSRLGQAFVNFLRALLRLILIVLLIGAIGAGIYYGLPYINKTFVAPVEQNTAHVTELEGKVATLQTQLDEMNGRVGSIESSIEVHTTSLDQLKEMQTTLEGELTQKNDTVLLKLNHEIMMTRALDMLGRARLYLAQSNFGLAKEDVQSARDLLVTIKSETKDPLLTQVIARLDLALGNLPAFPVVASGDLEIAWQLLMSGEPVNTITATPSPAAFSTFTLTPETLNLSSTPTAEPPINNSTATP